MIKKNISDLPVRLSFLIAFSLFTLCVYAQKKIRTPIKVIPALSVYTINGDTTNLKTISKGKVTFIDFWFIPCGPCFVEMNMLHKLYAKYKDDPNVCFLTITMTDSAFVRPLAENRNTGDNETYTYFKNLARLDTFKLPVYFIRDFAWIQKSFKKQKDGSFVGSGENLLKKNDDSPDNLFGFSGYPTIFIFDKKGKLIYNVTGFRQDGETQQKKKIESIISSAF